MEENRKMKRKTTICAITVLVIAGLLITSAAGLPTMNTQSHPATSDKEKNKKADVDYSCVEALGTLLNKPDLVNRKAGELERKDNIAAQSKKADMQTALVEMSPEEKVEINQYQEPEQSRQFYIIDALHPAWGSSKCSGRELLMYDLYFYNDSDQSTEFDGTVWTYSPNYTGAWGDEWHWVRGDEPLPSSYPSTDYWGYSTFENADEFFATWVDVTEDYYDDGEWYNGTNVSIMRIWHNDSDPLNPNVELRTWVGFGGDNTQYPDGEPDMWDMIMDDIACSDGLYFPEPYQDHDPWGMCSYIMTNNYNPTDPGYPVIEGPHMFWPVEYQGTTNWGLMSWFINDPANDMYVDYCEGTCTYIDDVTNGGYAVWDPLHRVAPVSQRGLMIAKIYDMNLAFDYPDPVENSYGTIWWLNNTDLNIEKPAIAANDGSVVIATQIDNISAPTEKWLSLWYCPNHNGEVGDQDNLSIAGIWSITDEEVLYPEVSHVYDDIFMVTFIIDNEMFATFSWDGGESWCVNQSPDWLEYYSWSGDDYVVSEYRSNELSDKAEFAVWEYDASSGGDFLTYLHYTPNTVKLDGYCFDAWGVPVDPVVVEMLELEYSTKHQHSLGNEPTVVGNYYSKTMLLGFDLWTDMILRIMAMDPGVPGSFGYKEHNFTEIYYVNTHNITVNYTLADMNLDGPINGFDIDPFVLALVNPDGYEATYGVPAAIMGDCNLDWLINGFDIDPFVQILVGGGYPVWP